MTGAIAAMAFAAIECELALLAQRVGNEARVRRHGGWAVILFAMGLSLGGLQLAASLAHGLVEP